MARCNKILILDNQHQDLIDWEAIWYATKNSHAHATDGWSDWLRINPNINGYGK